MTLRAGSSLVGHFRGLIRDDSYPWANCIHQHETPREAKECSRKAMSELRTQSEPYTLPTGWEPWTKWTYR